MKRGEVWTVAGGPGYTSKPRPAVILQANSFTELDSITLCPLTTNDSASLPYRICIEPDQKNGLRAQSCAMADKVSTLPKTKFGTYVGKLADADMARLSHAVLLFLGLDR